MTQGPRTKQSYLVTTTTQVRVDALSAADARRIADLIVVLKPEAKAITKTTTVDKIKD